MFPVCRGRQAPRRLAKTGFLAKGISARGAGASADFLVKAQSHKSDAIQGTPLSDDHNYTMDDLKLWLGPQAPTLEKRVALVEIWTGQAGISHEVASRGFGAIRIGLDHGHDLRRRKDRTLLLLFLNT